MQVFVTGATGNVGTALLAGLDRQNNDIYCLCRNPVELEGCHILQGDLSKLCDYRSVISSSDVIIHCASPRSNDKEIIFMEDILPTKELLDYWDKGKFIYISSQTVLGVCKYDICDNNRCYNPLCWYDYAKTVNELQLQMEEMKEKRKEKIILRIPLLLSAGPHRYDRQLSDQVFLQCRENGAFYFKSKEAYNSTGSSILSDRDCGRLIRAAIERGKSGIYNISSCYCTWREMIVFFSEKLGFNPNIVFTEEEAYSRDALYLPHNTARMLMDKQRDLLGITETDTAETILDPLTDLYNKELCHKKYF